MPKTEPQRTCVGCRAAGPQSMLRRVRGVAVGESITVTVGTGGRGAYLCQATAIECFDQARRRRAFARAFRGTVNEDSLDRLRILLSAGAT